jgi:twitching motility protein PilT
MRFYTELRSRMGCGGRRVEPSSEHEPNINKLFRLARKFEASRFDLHVGSPLVLWLRGVPRKVDMPPLSAQDLERLLPPILWDDQQKRLNLGEEVGFIYAAEEGDRFRVVVTRKDGALQVAAHWIEGA